MVRHVPSYVTSSELPSAFGLPEGAGALVAGIPWYIESGAWRPVAAPAVEPPVQVSVPTFTLLMSPDESVWAISVSDTGTLSAVEAGFPENQRSQTATVLTVGGSPYTVDMTHVLTDSSTHPGGQVWLEWVCPDPAPADAIFDTVGSSFDTYLVIYMLEPGAWAWGHQDLIEVDKDDDSAGADSPGASRVILHPEAGQSYLIELRSYYAYKGGPATLNYPDPA